MKTKFFISLIFISLVKVLNSQPLFWNNWQIIPTGTTSNLNYLTLDNTGNKSYGVGDNGKIVYTSNSGASWSLINTGYTNTLNECFFLSANFFICGSAGLISKSTNAGVSFSMENSGTTNNLNSLVLYSSQYGLAVGDNGIVLQKVNTTGNWNQVAIDTNVNLNHIVGFNGTQGLIVGDNGIMYKTSLEIPSLTFSITRIYPGTNLNLNFAIMQSTDNIWVTASNGKILHSVNGGTNWQIINTGYSNNLYSISFLSANELLVSGSGGLIIKSTDGGSTFSQLNSNTTSDIKGIIAKNDLGAAVGNGGIGLRSVLSASGGPFYKVQARLNPANISTWIWSTGVFNQDMRATNSPGFEWPKGTGKFSFYTSGLTLGAYVNSELRLATASYSGEYTGGYIENGIAKTNSNFQIFKIIPGDNCYNSVDYANWYTMIPFGAPYTDLNGNGQFDACIDKPGLKNAAQTVFVCMTDGFPQTHSSSEGFSGGTAPLNAEVHLTVWGYDESFDANLKDVLFFKWEIINKNNSSWNSFYSSIVCDPDLGDATDDYLGCDSTKNLGYCYNGDNQDGTGTGVSYGLNPPAVGMRMLKTPVNIHLPITDTINMSSFVYYNGGGSETCATDPSDGPGRAYNYLKGLKKDGTPYLNAQTGARTKYVFTGDPEGNSGWTEYFGRIENCNLQTSGQVVPSPPGNRRYVMSFGRDNFTVNSGDTQTIVMAEMVTRGVNNKNAVTKLKQLSDYVSNSFNAGNISIGINNQNQIIGSFLLFQNYPNPFNPFTTIKFQIPENTFALLKIYDVSGRVINTIVNDLITKGEYEYQWDAAAYPSGIYFYRLETESYTQTKKMILVK